ncbi:MAG: CNNM domain-containing protein [Candidatus Omnitrophota bacterium]
MNAFGIPQIIIVVLLLLLSALLSASETSLIGLSKMRLRHLVSKGAKGALGVQRLISKLDKVIAAILIGNNLINTAISVIVTTGFVLIFGPKLAMIISIFFLTFIILVFCEITPKILAIKFTEKVAFIVSPIMEVILKIFSPLIPLFTVVSDSILKVLRVEPVKRSPLITEEELRLMIEVGRDEGVLSDDERKMLYRIFEFGNIKVSDVMVPKEKIVAIDIKSDPEALLNILTEEGYSRIPVYRDSVDTIIGIIYAKDLLHIWRNNKLFTVDDLVHAPFYARPEAKVNDLLREFQKNKVQIAIVVGGENKTKGLVTLEDLFEEIVGEIEEDKKPLKNLKKKT